MLHHVYWSQSSSSLVPVVLCVLAVLVAPVVSAMRAVFGLPALPETVELPPDDADGTVELLVEPATGMAVG